MNNRFKIASLVAGVTMFSSLLVGCGNDDTTDVDTTDDKATTEEMTYTDGSYEGVGTGHNGDIVLEVKVDGGEISEVDVLESKETEILSDAAFEKITAGAVDYQSVNLDTVTGATVSSHGILAALKDALEEAGGTEEMFTQGEKISLATEEDELEQTYDVVVIGGGGAGMSAAIEAQEAGAEVVLLEKMSGLGGNTLVSGGGMNAPGTDLQKEQGIEDSVELFVEDALEGGDHVNQEELVQVIGDNALDTVNWLTDDLNVEFMEGRLMQFGGHSVPRALIPINSTGVEIIDKLHMYGEDLGITYKTETKAEELILDDDGKVVGVKATNEAGQELTFNAENGVIIASGGFAADLDMRTKYDPEKDDKYLTTTIAGSTGDGILMAEAIEGDLVDMEYIQTYPVCNPKTGIISYVADSRFDGAILLNQEGDRFVEEMDRRDVISEAILDQTNSEAYLVWGQEIEEIANMSEVHSDEYDVLVDMDLLHEADTLEELADYFNIDEDSFMESIERYNTFAENGEDEDFNRRGDLRPIKEGPFIIQRVAPAVHHTMGGIVINTNAEVLNTSGEVIPGLFAAGEVTGGIHGANRLGGNAIIDILVYGRTAGQNVVQ